MITDFIRSSGVNISGLAKVEFVPVSLVFDYPLPFEQEISSSIVLVGTSQWLKAYYTQGTGGFSCTDEKDPSGCKYIVAISGFLAKEQWENTALFHKMTEDGFIVIAYDSNGNRRVGGTIENPLRFTWSETTLTQLGGRAGYQWQFAREMTEPAPYYTAV